MKKVLVTFDPDPGEHIYSCISEAIKECLDLKCPVMFTFNGKGFYINPMDLYAIFQRQQKEFFEKFKDQLDLEVSLKNECEVENES